MEITARVTEHPKYGPMLAGATAADAYRYLQGENGHALRTWDDAEYLLDEWIMDNAIFEGNGEDEGANLYYEWRDAALRWIDVQRETPTDLDPVLIRVAYLTLESHRDAYDGTWPETVAAVTEWETREGFTTEYLQDHRGDGTPLADGRWYMEKDKELAAQVLAALHKLASMTEDEAAEMAFNLTEVGMS